MKKTLPVLVAVLCITSAAHAQIAKGKTFLGGTISYNQANSESATTNTALGKQRSFYFNPAIGRTVKENLIVGVEANYAASSYANYSSTNKLESKAKSYGGAVFVRRYVPLVKNFYFFGQGTVGAGRINNSETNNAIQFAKTTGWSASVTLAPGLSYAITRKFLVEAGLNSLASVYYNHQVAKTVIAGVETDNSKTNSFGISTSIGNSGGFNIGFRLLL